MTPIIFAMQGNEPMAAKMSQLRGWELGSWDTRRFPDGESFVRYLSEIKGRDIAIVCSLDRPDEKSIALYLAACVARELGARQIGLVVPYLAYMRQDIRFHAGRNYGETFCAPALWRLRLASHGRSAPAQDTQP